MNLVLGIKDVRLRIKPIIYQSDYGRFKLAMYRVTSYS